MLQPSSMLLVWVILFSSGAAAAAGDVLTTPSTVTTHSFSQNTNVKTLDILKEELQKNNDDYKDRSPNGPQGGVKSADQSAGAPSRRALGAEPTAPASPARPAKPKKYSSVAAPAAATNRNPKYVNKKPVPGDRKKVDKLRNFHDKYKVIVNEFVTNRSESPLPAPAPPAPAPPPAPPRRQQAPAGAAEPPQWNSASDEAPVLRAEELPAGLDHRPPNAQQLDMSPARGGNVENLRDKNRLCHRHVMIPEGPKYDSQGKVYLAEYKQVREREYTQTRAPRFLLPKCCNCCRKSVLGCE